MTGEGPLFKGEGNVENSMQMTFRAISRNEGFARVCVAAFATQLDPTVEEIADLKTAVSEAVTNAIVHAYPNTEGEVTLRMGICDGLIHIAVEDTGVGIADVERAMQPFYTTAARDERSGMGFMVMQTFMDEVRVQSAPGKGTVVTMKKRVVHNQ